MFHCTIQSRHARIAIAIENTDYWHCLFPVVSSLSATQGLKSLDGLTTSTRPTLSITRRGSDRDEAWMALGIG